MNLNKLKTFIVVAELGSVTEAAYMLFRTQPAISQQIKDLEKDTKLRLLERKKSRVYLTKEGQELYNYAKQRVREIEDKASELRNDSSQLEGTLRIGVLIQMSASFIAEIINHFLNEYPKVDFIITQHDHVDLEQKLLSNELDFAFIVLYEDKKFFEIHSYFKFKRILVASKEYLKSRGKIKTYNDLLEQDIIEYDPNMPDFYCWLNKNSPQQSTKVKRIRAKVSIKDAETYHQLILKGRGIGLVNKFVIEHYLESGKLVEILPKSKPLYITIDISRRKVHTKNLLNETFLKFVLSNRNI